MRHPARRRTLFRCRTAQPQRSDSLRNLRLFLRKPCGLVFQPDSSLRRLLTPPAFNYASNRLRTVQNNHPTSPSGLHCFDPLIARRECFGAANNSHAFSGTSGRLTGVSFSKVASHRSYKRARRGRHRNIAMQDMLELSAETCERLIGRPIEALVDEERKNECATKADRWDMC